MAKVVVRKLARHASKGRSSMAEKRVTASNGQVVKVRTIDANSPTFGADLHLIFTQNVAKARRENKRKFGSPDRVGRKV